MTCPISTRRTALKLGAGVSATAMFAPGLLGRAAAQPTTSRPNTSAKVNWKQAEGEQITVAVIPASYFENLISLQPQFEALTGIKLRFEEGAARPDPPEGASGPVIEDRHIRHAAADPMYYALYVSNKWVGAARHVSERHLAHDPAWFNYDDIIKAWRDADSIDGKPYGIPFDGEVTVQVYRKDLYDAKGLKPAETYDDLLSNAKALTDANTRVFGLALRGFAGAGQNMYIYPSLFRGFGALDQRQGHHGQFRRSGAGARLVRQRAWPIRAAGGAEMELAGYRRCLLARNGCDLRRRPFVRGCDHQSREVEGGRQNRLRAGQRAER